LQEYQAGKSFGDSFLLIFIELLSAFSFPQRMNRRRKSTFFLLLIGLWLATTNAVQTRADHICLVIITINSEPSCYTDPIISCRTNTKRFEPRLE
jgi:hypothetical protein